MSINPKLRAKFRKYERLQRELRRMVCEMEDIQPELHELVDGANHWSLSMWLIQSPFIDAKEAEQIAEGILKTNIRG